MTDKFEQISNKLLIFGEDVARQGGSFVIVSKNIISDNFNIVAYLKHVINL